MRVHYMNNLHTVNSAAALDSCRPFLIRGDVLLLVQNGVYAGLGDNLGQLATETGIEICALQEDLNLRGLTERIPAYIRSVSYVEFVGLCCATKKTISWL